MANCLRQIPHGRFTKFWHPCSTRITMHAFVASTMFIRARIVICKDQGSVLDQPMHDRMPHWNVHAKSMFERQFEHPHLVLEHMHRSLRIAIGLRFSGGAFLGNHGAASLR